MLSGTRAMQEQIGNISACGAHKALTRKFPSVPLPFWPCSWMLHGYAQIWMSATTWNASMQNMTILSINGTNLTRIRFPSVPLPLSFRYPSVMRVKPVVPKMICPVFMLRAYRVFFKSSIYMYPNVHWCTTIGLRARASAHLQQFVMARLLH